MSKTIKTYAGLLSLHEYGEADDILFLSTVKSPLAEELQWMKNKNVSVRYWVTDKQVTKEEAETEFTGTLLGKARGKFGAVYSEMTGYLWTDEELIIGGHDLINELRSYEGKWLILEAESLIEKNE